jgi:aminoglycoside 3-N-acetyltransferase
MIQQDELIASLKRLEIDRAKPVIAHGSLSAFGYVEGGAHTIVEVLISVFQKLIMPTFTYQTMVIPELGPADNAIEYGGGQVQNSQAEFFRPDMPTHLKMGAIVENFRMHTDVHRTMHPILSFSGYHAEEFLKNQTIANPLETINALWKAEGWVILLGVDQRSNTSIHYGEQLAGRNQFIRWALTPGGVIECPQIPGCSFGFNAILSHIQSSIHEAKVNNTQIQAIPLGNLIPTTRDMILKDPLALLCERPKCESCQAIRTALQTN